MIEGSMNEHHGNAESSPAESSSALPPNEAATPSPTAPSLKKRAIQGSIITLGTYGLSTIIRLGTSVITAKLLFPEAFGLMALIFTFISMLEMLSDFGVRQNIVRSERGDDPTFLNTAWTFQVVRSLILWVCACILAYPLSLLYNQPLLLPMLPVVALNIVFAGFASTKLHQANRHLQFKRISALELASQIIGNTVSISFAYISTMLNAPDSVRIWALVFGVCVYSIVRMVLSHRFLPGMRNRFCWDKTALGELKTFGRWIFISTMVTFFALQGNNLVIPKLLGFGVLGVFSIAQTLSRASFDVLNIMSDRILFPSYSELLRDRPERLYPVLRRARIVLNAMNFGVCLFFVLFGKLVIQILYPKPEYADGGWMLQILAVGAAITVLGSSYTNVLLAQGKTFTMFVLMCIQLSVQFVAMFTGYWVGQQYGLTVHGTIIGISIASWALYPFQAVCFARLKLWQPEVDVPFIGLAIGLACLATSQILGWIPTIELSWFLPWFGR
jgi:O-antigen/teichoic acid export membrane protein